MTAATERTLRFPRAARPLVWLAMPVMGVLNQYLAERTAHALMGLPFGPGWLWAAIRSPWVEIWIGSEIVTLGFWMIVLSNLTLSAAFPMTALGYVLVIGLGWTVFAEPITIWQIVGGAAILAGVWLLGEKEKPS